MKWIISGSYGVLVEANSEAEALAIAKEMPLYMVAYGYKGEELKEAKTTRGWESGSHLIDPNHPSVRRND